VILYQTICLCASLPCLEKPFFLPSAKRLIGEGHPGWKPNRNDIIKSFFGLKSDISVGGIGLEQLYFLIKVIPSEKIA